MRRHVSEAFCSEKCIVMDYKIFISNVNSFICLLEKLQHLEESINRNQIQSERNLEGKLKVLTSTSLQSLRPSTRSGGTAVSGLSAPHIGSSAI